MPIICRFWASLEEQWNLHTIERVGIHLTLIVFAGSYDGRVCLCMWERKRVKKGCWGDDGWLEREWERKSKSKSEREREREREREKERKKESGDAGIKWNFFYRMPIRNTAKSFFEIWITKDLYIWTHVHLFLVISRIAWNHIV